jgi:Galactose oxidase, central domain
VRRQDILTTAKRSTTSLTCGFALPLLFLAVVVSPTSLVMAQLAGTFTPTGSMTTSRLSHTATLLADGRVLIAGGQIFSDGKWSGTRSAELYDPSTGTFTATGHLTTTRLYHTATLLPDGKVLIVGGLASESHYLATAELYDPHTGTFTRPGDLAAARAPTATLLPDGRVLIADRSAELYNPSTGTFTATGQRTTTGLYQTATLLPGGKVLMAGGLDGESKPLATAELFDPATGTFTATGDMTTASFFVFPGGPLGRVLHTSSLLPDGTVLMAGGWPNPGKDLASAELYDPLGGTFSATGSMATGRASHTSTLLNDGSVLITGGIENYDSLSVNPIPLSPIVLDSAELYHPAVLRPPPALLALSGDGRGQGAIQHADTYQLVSPGNPAAAGEALIIYCTGLADGSVIPAQVAIGGRMAELLWFGKTPGFAGLNQIDVRVPSGIAPGPAVPVRLNYLGRSSNEVTLGGGECSR